MCSSSRSYQDFLAPRKQEFSNFMWASRHIKPQIAYRQEKKPFPQYHKDEVLKSAKIQELLITLSKQQNVGKEVLEAKVRNILDEIGYNKKLKVIRWLGLVLVKICNKICSGIYINEDAVLKLKSVMGDCPVIFVPSHRSYADFILMSLMCFTEDVAIPAIAAGMDFHGMWGMGTVLRDTGAFFMRRSYSDDSLYWTTFKQYVYQLVTKGELPIEFFIEGTRSRSNKSLLPKYGLFLMILKAFFLSQVPDILFVPINISYDRIMEEKLFAFELLGIPKLKETTSGFFKSLSIVNEKFGSIYFDVAEPISVKKFFGPDLDRSVHSLQPIHLQEITEDEKKIIPALAYEIVYKQQKHCIINAFNLIAIILHNNLSSGHALLILNELMSEVIWLKEIIESLGGFVHMGDVKNNVLEALDVHENIVSVNNKGEVNLIWNNVVVDKIDSKKMKAHELSEKTLTLSVPFIMLQIYINPVLHYIIDMAVLVTVLKSHSQPLNKDDLFGNYHFLRTLFSQEFVTFHTRTEMEFDNALQNGLKLNLIAHDGASHHLGNNKKLEEIICNCFDLFVLTYYVVCCILLQVSSRTIEEKSILIKVQADIEERINKNDVFIHPYSLSLDTISNCLNTLVSQKALIKSRNKGSITYELDNGQILLIKTKLEIYIPSTQILMKKRENVQLHLKNKL